MCPKAAAQGANPAGHRPDLHYLEPELGTAPRSSPVHSLGRSGSALVIWFQILPSGSALSGEAKITFLWLVLTLSAASARSILREEESGKNRGKRNEGVKRNGGKREKVEGEGVGKGEEIKGQAVKHQWKQTMYKREGEPQDISSKSTAGQVVRINNATPGKGGSFSERHRLSFPLYRWYEAATLCQVASDRLPPSKLGRK